MNYVETCPNGSHVDWSNPTFDPTDAMQCNSIDPEVRFTWISVLVREAGLKWSRLCINLISFILTFSEVGLHLQTPVITTSTYENDPTSHPTPGYGQVPSQRKAESQRPFSNSNLPPTVVREACRRCRTGDDDDTAVSNWRALSTRPLLPFSHFRRVWDRRPEVVTDGGRRGVPSRQRATEPATLDDCHSTHWWYCIVLTGY
jgi:hypothetical protein